jgi:hypothetical protein
MTWLQQNPTEDQRVQRTVIRLLPIWGTGPIQIRAFLISLSNPGIRGEAIAALDSLAPVTGQVEARLLTEVGNLRRVGWNFIQVRAMPRLYGRDPRLLACLAGFVRTGNRWQRALARSQLCGLGETQAAFSASSDQHPGCANV